MNCTCTDYSDMNALAGLLITQKNNRGSLFKTSNKNKDNYRDRVLNSYFNIPRNIKKSANK